MLPILRILIGLVFTISGAEKALAPYQNFAYVLESYQLLPGWLEAVAARLFPWIELFIGLFLVLGLWTKKALAAAVCMTGMFVLVVAQALVRRLPLDQCGCFGELLHIPPRSILVFDSAMLLILFVLFRNSAKTARFGLDSQFLR